MEQIDLIHQQIPFKKFRSARKAGYIINISIRFKGDGIIVFHGYHAKMGVFVKTVAEVSECKK